MKVRDIMNRPPQTCHEYTELGTASRRMREDAIGMLVVLGDRGMIEGVVTDRDLALAIDRYPNQDIRRLPVGAVMTRGAHTCREDDDVRDALMKMVATHTRRLPVLSEDGDLTAVLTIDDIVLWAAGHGGLTPGQLTAALRRIYSPRTIRSEPEFPVP